MARGKSMTVTSRYLAIADSQAYERPESPFMGLVDERAAGLRCFQRYSKEATRDIMDGHGQLRWVTKKQSLVAAIVDRVAMSPSARTTMKDIAAEAGCTVSTVSRAIQKLQSFALYAIEVRRGRNGGITVHRRSWDRFWDYVSEARRRIREGRIRAQGKLASVIPLMRKSDGGLLPKYPVPTVASFTDDDDDGDLPTLREVLLQQEADELLKDLKF